MRRALLLCCLAGCEQVLGITTPKGTPPDATYRDGFQIDAPREQCADGTMFPELTWGTPANYSAPGSRGLAVGNLDGDTIADVAVATDTDVLIFEGSGSGPGVSRQLHAGTATAATDLLIADIDGDSRNDVVTWSGTTVAVHRQSATTAGTFLPPQNLSTASPITTNAPLMGWSAVHAARLDADAFVDLVVTTMTEVRAYRSNPSTPGELVAGSMLAGSNVAVSAIADVDGDTYDDVVLGGMQTSVAFNTPSAPGTFTPAMPVGPMGASGMAGGAPGRFAENELTRRDLIVFGQSWTLYKHVTPRSFVEGDTVYGSSTGNGPALTVDVNADGNDDVVDFVHYALLCPDHKSFAIPANLSDLPHEPESPTSQVFADLDSNGKPDLLRVYNGAFLRVFLQ